MWLRNGSTEGIQRKGSFIHPDEAENKFAIIPFLQDGSVFSPERSHKLSRLTEMVEEAIAEGTC